ncbi:4-hydroxy-tetrahydrodipicolinate synthase [Tardiphaga sp.]|uniref:4-hydroxy-tetrahydrodipicolinate synthase n=1 Tax=Tardiphaga sp. TaxID=1926292 RepID=UPI00260C7C0D|nr:4-hydroxy-tetrahydrodipicolinate synthase [Tardiphaga sp.]MDB5618317.1 dihydrodipicolinate synthase [Tardiphaga sp.]
MTSALDYPWLAGVIADLPTPFDEHDGIDLIAFARLCEQQVEADVSALLVGETMGELPTLTIDEHDALVRTAVATARGRVKVIAGAGSNATAHAITLTQNVEAAGADAILSVVPYYNRPTQAGIAAHFRAVAAATSLPIIVHDAPCRTMRPLADETLLQLAESAQFIGLCDGSGDITRPLRLRGGLPRGFRLLSGHNATTMAFLFYAGDGSICSIASITPGLMHELYQTGRQQGAVYATHLMDRIAPLATVLAQDATPASLKYALSLRDLCLPRVRLPIVALARPEKTAIAEAMAAALGP